MAIDLTDPMIFDCIRKLLVCLGPVFVSVEENLFSYGGDCSETDPTFDHPTRQGVYQNLLDPVRPCVPGICQSVPRVRPCRSYIVDLLLSQLGRYSFNKRNDLFTKQLLY